MINISKIKVSELAKIANQSNPTVSKKIREFDFNKDLIIKSTKGSKIIGLLPDAAEEYLEKSGIHLHQGPAVILSANVCGGVGKTTSVISLGTALRRICNRSSPIVFVDGDSQGSLTSTFFKEPALDSEPILMDFLDKKVSIKQILTEMEENIWVVKSNLNQALLDKSIATPRDIKEKMFYFYQAIFNVLGEKTKIFQDHPPQLSCLFASSVCALHQLNNNVLKAIVIPIRGDRFALQGASHIIREVNEIKGIFNFQGNLNMYCFFSSLDGRISATKETLEIAKTREDIARNLSGCAIRYCGKVPKSIVECNTIFAESKKSKAAEDYQELLSEIFIKE
jgi:cellulose biosynthesis protein BcsQ